MPQLERRLNRNRFSLPCLLLARTQMLYQHCGLYALQKLASQAESIVLISSLWGKLTWSKSGYLRSRFALKPLNKASCQMFVHAVHGREA